jgi:hypothetical protein
MSEEEKKAIERLKDLISKSKVIEDIDINKQVAFKDITTILNLTKKQQEEIEELKEYKHDAELTKVSCCTAQNCEALNNCIKLRRELQNADKKIQKQQEKIKELTAFYNSFESGEIVNYPIFKQRYINKDKIRELKQSIHNALDKNGITRGYQQIIDKSFDELLEEI